MRYPIPESLKTIRTKPLFNMRVDVKPILVVGETPFGKKKAGFVTGGTFEGDRVSGTILDGGSDWQSVLPDGSTILNARFPLKTNDGAIITMSFQGIRTGPKAILEKIGKGEAVDPTSYYFRITASFETAAPQYDWMNRIVVIGSGHRLANGPVYSLFEVL